MPEIRRRVSVVIPAHNEAPNLPAVLKPISETDWIEEIIVVDDGSKDATKNVVAEFPKTQVLINGECMGKAISLKRGLDQASGDLIIFLDGDLLGLRRDHLDSLVQPLISGEAETSLGIPTGGRLLVDLANKIAPNLSGQRAFWRNDLLGFQGWEGVGFGIEQAFKDYFRGKRLRTEYVPLRGLSQVMKEEKRGFLVGFLSRLRMYYEILRYKLNSSMKRAVNRD